MAKINVINNETQDLTIDPGATGDSIVKFEINTVSEFTIGVDDDAGDSFKLSQGGVLGANDTFIMTAAGVKRLPLNPSFFAAQSATATNVTGDGSVHTIVCNTEIFDQGADYNNGTGTFVAPITGRYLLGCSITLTGIAAAHTTGYLYLVTSNGNFSVRKWNEGAMRNPSSANRYGDSCFADLDALDTVNFTYVASGGALAVDVAGGLRNTCCWGDLVC